MFETQLAVYKIVFMAELLVSETLFVFRLKRRSYFAFRAALSAALCMLTAFLFPVPVFNAVYTSVMFLVMFLVTVVALKFCFDESWYDVLFCGIAAYTVQHLSYEIYNYTCTVSGLNELFTGIYSDGTPTPPNGYMAILYGGVYATVYWLMYLFFGERIKSHEVLTLKGASLLGLAALIILVDIVLNAVATYRSYEEQDLIYNTVIFLYNILCCLLALVTQFGLLSRRNLERELRFVYELRDQEEQQYYISKDSIDLINRKCHDIKHQIRKFGQNESLSEEVIKDMEETISIYDTSVKTGNKALDTILSEKKLFCKLNDIKFTCMADGSKLDFIKDVSIYSLFGNMLDNAIEAVMGLDAEKRIIGLVVRSENDFLSVSCYNYFDKELKFENGMPVTSKNDRDYHGFGLKSIRTIAEGYGGNVSALAEDNIFTLNILLPYRREKAAAEEKKPREKKSFIISRRKLLLFVVPLVCIVLYVSVGLLIVSNYYAAFPPATVALSALLPK